MTGKLSALKQQFSMLEGAAIGSGASNEAIDESEAVLGVVFPAALREYLLEFGYVSVGVRELFGLGADVPRHLHLTQVTLEERADFFPNIPVWLLPVENNGAGDHYCLDLSVGASDPSVVFWSHDEGESQVPEMVCHSFVQWLSGLAVSAA